MFHTYVYISYMYRFHYDSHVNKQFSLLLLKVLTNGSEAAVVNLQPETPVFKIRNLELDAKYYMRVSAKNYFGESDKILLTHAPLLNQITDESAGEESEAEGGFQAPELTEGKLYY